MQQCNRYPYTSQAQQPDPQPVSHKLMRTILDMIVFSRIGDGRNDYGSGDSADLA
jgi:hypothetical protein